jgi:hypothetical protein
MSSSWDDKFLGAEDSGSDKEENKTTVHTGVFDCDKKLPERGIGCQTKKFLLTKLDEKGGLNKVSRQSKLLEQICDSHPDELGCVGPELRKRVQVTVDHWKRHKDFSTVRSKIIAKAALASPPPLPTRKPSSKKSPQPARRASSPPKSLPSLKRAKTASTMSTTSFGSPGSCLGRSSRRISQEKTSNKKDSK